MLKPNPTRPSQSADKSVDFDELMVSVLKIKLLRVTPVASNGDDITLKVAPVVCASKQIACLNKIFVVFLYLLIVSSVEKIARRIL